MENEGLDTLVLGGRFWLIPSLAVCIWESYLASGSIRSPVSPPSDRILTGATSMPRLRLSEIKAGKQLAQSPIT